MSDIKITGFGGAPAGFDENNKVRWKPAPYAHDDFETKAKEFVDS